jgi:hypothetical protein
MRYAVGLVWLLLLAGCFGAHAPIDERDAGLDVPACVDAAPRMLVPAGPGCATLELTVQDLPTSPLSRCVLGASREDVVVQPVYVANLGADAVHVEVQPLSRDCFAGTIERCGAVAASDASGCDCGAPSYDSLQLVGRTEPTFEPLLIPPPGGTVYLGGDRIRYRVVACRLPTGSDPFPLACEPGQEAGDVDPALCQGVTGHRVEAVDDIGRGVRACYCAPRCVTAEDCPRTGPGEVQPICDENGVCRLPCDGEGTCPEGTACVRIPQLETRFNRPICATTTGG